jgi:Sortase domain
VMTGRLADWWDPAWDADWWGAAWNEVRPAGMAERPDARGARGPAAAGPAPAPEGTATPRPEPSWGRILATTLSLWVSRRLPRFRIRRVLAASMLGAGLLAVGAGTAGLVVAGRVPVVRLPAAPSPVPAPSGRGVASAGLTAVRQPARPIRLTIPAIGVRAAVVDLGLNPNGTLQVPATTTVVGWYTGSPRPGAVGPAVIAGHVDSRAGPGVFFWLRTLRPGERLYVGRADGTTAVFAVTSVRLYAKDKFPTAAVYGAVPDAELRLITCGGTFDRSLGSYLSNVVVYARLTG